MLDIPVKPTIGPFVNKNPENNSYPVPYFYYQYGNRTYSVYSAYIPDGAEMVRDGWTVKHIDGTSGLARGKFESEEQAQAWCDANPKFAGMSRMCD